MGGHTKVILVILSELAGEFSTHYPTTPFMDYYGKGKLGCAPVQGNVTA